MIKRLLLLLIILTIAAFAQVGEIGVNFGDSRLSNNDLGSGLSIKTNFRFGFRFTFNNPSHFGHEIGYAYNHGKLTIVGGGANGQNVDLGMPIHQGMYNFLLYGTKEGSTVRPFATGGVHFSSFYPPGASVFSGNGVTKFGFNYGGGLKVKVSDVFLIRFDLRQYQTGKPDFGQVTVVGGLLRQLEISSGLSFTF